MSDSEEETGPNPLRGSQPKRVKLDTQILTLLDSLPNAAQYEKSWMHRHPVTHVVYASRTNFLITGSAQDGVVKFWKHVGGSQLLEFVRQFLAHSRAISSLSASRDGEQLCSTSAEEETIRFFLVRTFDMACFASTPGFAPAKSSWTEGDKVCIACGNTKRIRIYNSSTCEVYRELANLSPKPTVCLTSRPNGIMISCDQGGVISYWNVEPSSSPTLDTQFKFKLETDLFMLAKLGLVPVFVETTNGGQRFVVCCNDGSIRLFDFATGKLLFDFPNHRATQVEFDASGRLLLVPSVHANDGGKRVDVIELDQFTIIASTLASGEQEEEGIESIPTPPFALFQGILKTDYQLERNLSGAMGMTNNQREERQLQHPLFVCAGDENRFFVFTQTEPDTQQQRNVLNEKPTQAQIAKELHQQKLKKAQGLAKTATIHTTLGDIHIELFPLECPKTVENFIGHASGKRQTYVDCPFHRVIRGFMVQTGDPAGDGTGGESIWGGTFEDEISPELKFNQPFLVCMANRGKNTNGSQFFITVPGGNGCAHLEGKHTIFGRVVGESSQEVVKRIELVKVDSNDCPIREVKIASVSIS
ncbi:hypothetical protein BASA81_006615 [Batrachochytrium salamandrivorans]|nr:hypothetical protein BASA81_006615 [Batrachochytrium salamandrivorans]